MGSEKLAPCAELRLNAVALAHQSHLVYLAKPRFMRPCRRATALECRTWQCLHVRSIALARLDRRLEGPGVRELHLADIDADVADVPPLLCGCAYRDGKLRQPPGVRYPATCLRSSPHGCRLVCENGHWPRGRRSWESRAHTNCRSTIATVTANGFLMTPRVTACWTTPD
jgi:hypothetical protein